MPCSVDENEIIELEFCRTLFAGLPACIIQPIRCGPDLKRRLQGQGSCHFLASSTCTGFRGPAIGDILAPPHSAQRVTHQAPLFLECLGRYVRAALPPFSNSSVPRTTYSFCLFSTYLYLPQRLLHLANNVLHRDVGTVEELSCLKRVLVRRNWDDVDYGMT